jgi:hypothetical protein
VTVKELRVLLQFWLVGGRLKQGEGRGKEKLFAGRQKDSKNIMEPKVDGAK